MDYWPSKNIRPLDITPPASLGSIPLSYANALTDTSTVYFVQWWNHW